MCVRTATAADRQRVTPRYLHRRARQGEVTYEKNVGINQIIKTEVRTERERASLRSVRGGPV